MADVSGTKLKLVDAVMPFRSQQVVEMLETLLERARQGDFEQMSAAWVAADGSTGNQFTAIKGTHPVKMLGSIDVLHFRIQRFIETECG